MHKKAPRSFTSTTRWYISTSRSTTGVLSSPLATAALFIKISTRPNCLTVSWTASDTAVGSVTSKTKDNPLRFSFSICSTTLSTSCQPMDFSSAGKVSGSRPVPVTATSAPSLAKATAAARPIPLKRPAPVTNATFLSSSPTLFPRIHIYRSAHTLSTGRRGGY